jgi:carbon-monoxide dehydrogenase small subunit
MLLTAYELVSSGAAASRADIREFLSGNMCRCTGYHAIIDAVAAVIEARAPGGNSLDDNDVAARS